MKVTLDLEKLLSEGSISQVEYEKLKGLTASDTGSLAFNLLIGFGVVAVSCAALALVPAPTTAIVIGLCVMVSGLVLVRSELSQWEVLANICVLAGTLMTSGGILTEAEGSLGSILFVTAILAITAIVAKSALLTVLATLMLSAAVGARTGYFHASYFLVVQEPTLTIVLFSLLAIALYQLSKKLSADYERLAIAAARTGVLLVNFGFWVGSLWGEVSETSDVVTPDYVFSLLWAVLLVATAIWSWRRNRRWVLNTVAVFAGIHFYTQWFEHLGASPITVLVAGLIALGAAVGLRRINSRVKTSIG